MELKVGDVMTRGVIYVRPEDTIKKVAEIMRKNDIDSVIVMKNGRGVGIVTDTDIIRKIVAEGKDPKKHRVGEIMSSPLITISPDADIDDAAKKMSEQRIKRLVVTKNNKIIGIISEFDLINVEPALHTLIREHSMWSIADISPEPGSLSGICEICNNYSDDLRVVNGRLMCETCAKG